MDIDKCVDTLMDAKGYVVLEVTQIEFEDMNVRRIKLGVLENVMFCLTSTCLLMII